ncbi:MAG: DUF2252 family protein [Polyangiaceae bacterium]
MLEREDPFSLAARQIQIDRDRIRDGETAARKVRRLSATPHGFLRGSAPLFYEILAQRPDLSHGPDGVGWLVGDMHLENVGAYRTDDDSVVFDLNDFDDAFIGPWQIDVLRLVTSVLLASQAFEAPGHQAVDYAALAVTSHVAAAFDGARVVPESCEPIAQLIEQCRTRRRRDFLEDNTEVVNGKRRIKRGKRTFDVTEEEARTAPTLLAAYVRALGEYAPAHADRWRVADAAERIAGNGSLGRKRIWVLVDDAGEQRFIELKQATTPAPAILLGPTLLDPAERVVSGARSMLARPIFRLAPIPGRGERLPFVGRRLRPDEDKLDLSKKQLGLSFAEIVRVTAGLLGRAHRRGMTIAPTAKWTEKEQENLVDRAIEMASLHQGAWLAYSRLSRAEPRGVDSAR